MLMLIGVCLVVLPVVLGKGIDTIVPAVITGVIFICISFSMYPLRIPKIDVSVSNKILGFDNKGNYLVQAKTSRQITGPLHHVEKNLPADLIQVQKGLWVVSFKGGVHSGNVDKLKFKYVPDGYSIQPRGNTKTNGSLADQMLGYDHNYIRKDNDV